VGWYEPTTFRCKSPSRVGLSWQTVRHKAQGEERTTPFIRKDSKRMKMQDRMLDVIVAKSDIPNMIRSWFPDYIDDNNVICPFHDDVNASLHLSPDGKAKCHGGCGFFARNVVDLFAKMEDFTYDEARKILYDEISNAIPVSRVNAFHKALMKNNDALNYLWNSRMIGVPWVKKYNLGYDPRTNRITVPILDQFGTCVNIRYLSWQDNDTKFKAINHKGHGEVRLYPENMLIRENKVLLCEGEFDCLVARSHGIQAVTWTGGADNYNEDYMYMFQGKTVLILYDNDEAGEAGKWKMIDKLRGVAGAFKTVDPLHKKGKDITDWARINPELMIRLKTFMDNYNVKLAKVKKVCPTCGGEMK